MSKPLLAKLEKVLLFLSKRLITVTVAVSVPVEEDPEFVRVKAVLLTNKLPYDR